MLYKSINAVLFDCINSSYMLTGYVIVPKMKSDEWSFIIELLESESMVLRTIH